MTNIILFVVTIFVTAKLIGRILALEESVMEKEDEIRMLKRAAACQESTIARMRVEAVGRGKATETVDPVEELEEGEIREPVRDRRR